MAAKKNNGLGTVIFVMFILLLFFYQLNKCSSGNKKNTSGSDNGGASQNELQFSDDFNISIANQDDLGLSLVLAVDCSGSMNDYPTEGGESKKFEAASESIKEILMFIKDFYKENLEKDSIILKLSIVTFSDVVNIVYPLTEIDENTINAMIEFASQSSNFDPDGQTAIGDTIAKGAEILSQSGTIFKSLIIISDGENTAGVDPALVLDSLVNNRNNKSTKEFPVLTNNILVSFVGFDIDTGKFSALEQGGAKLTQADNKEQLNETLKNLFLSDISKLEAE